LRERAVAAGVGDRLETLAASIGELDFAPGSFDTAWSEGAIYTIGFDTALHLWRPLLSERGVLACSEMCWLRDAPSQRARDFIGQEYPAIRTIDANLAAAENAGYRVLDHFVLPERDWREEYYGPVAQRVVEVRRRHPGSADAEAVLRSVEEEIAVYDACSADYGYVFFIFQRD
jgi:hypothetical protein